MAGSWRSSLPGETAEATTSGSWIRDRPGSAELLLQAPEGSWVGPVDFSDNGRYLLVQQFVSVTDSRIYIMDLRNRGLWLAAGNPEEQSANRAISFDRRGKGFFFITNEHGLAAELAWRSLELDSVAQFITSQIRWDVSEFAVSPDGKRGAFVTNENGVSRLYLLNTKTGDYSLVRNIPVGLITGLKFNQDNRRNCAEPQYRTDAQRRLRPATGAQTGKRQEVAAMDVQRSGWPGRV